MLSGAVPLKIVLEILGHSQISITADTYMHDTLGVRLHCELVRACLTSGRDCPLVPRVGPSRIDCCRRQKVTFSQ